MLDGPLSSPSEASSVQSRRELGARHSHGARYINREPDTTQNVVTKAPSHLEHRHTHRGKERDLEASLLASWSRSSLPASQHFDSRPLGSTFRCMYASLCILCDCILNCIQQINICSWTRPGRGWVGGQARLLFRRSLVEGSPETAKWTNFTTSCCT